MGFRPLSDEEQEALLEAQLDSLQNGEELLAGTASRTSEWGWWALEGIVVRDESGKEEELLNRLLSDEQGGATA